MAAAMVAVPLLSLGCVCASRSVNLDIMSIQAIIIGCPACRKMQQQKAHLACHRDISNNVCCNNILLVHCHWIDHRSLFPCKILASLLEQFVCHRHHECDNYTPGPLSQYQYRWYQPLSPSNAQEVMHDYWLCGGQLQVDRDRVMSCCWPPSWPYVLFAFACVTMALLAVGQAPSSLLPVMVVAHSWHSQATMVKWDTI